MWKIRLDQDTVIERFINVHGYKYNYSLVEYVSMHVKVKIICEKNNHGMFLQTPANHLSNHGCAKCAFEMVSNSQRLTLEEFIIRANNKHEFIYDYSKFIYINIHTKGIIICNKDDHGEFLQEPNAHINTGEGCPECGRQRIYDSHRMSLEEFLDRSFKINGNRYDYSLITTINNVKENLLIICNKNNHGIFYQCADAHLNAKAGCPKCAHDNLRGTLKEFIEISYIVHGKKYDYSKFIYLGTFIKGIIICKKNHHGEFLQDANSHQSGKGCPKCTESAGERMIRVFLEKNDITYIPQKTFDDCRNGIVHKNSPKGKMYLFDFYLPDFNKIIEFDGSYHYSPDFLKNIGIKHAKHHTLESYNRGVLRDETKTNYCNNSNIKLLRIPFWNILLKKPSTIKEIENYIKEFIGFDKL